MREQILNNIRGEIRGHLRNGNPLPARDPRWDQDIAIIMAEEKRNLEHDQIEQIDSMYRNYHKKHVTGITYEEWLEKARSLYRIDGSTVHSIADGPDNGREWSMPDHMQAHKKVLKLISYKRYDHFIRGHDFAYDPVTKDIQSPTE